MINKCIFSIDDNYVPKKGDTVSFKKMLMPPKNEKMMAVHIKLIHLAEGVEHESWDEALEHDMEHRRSSKCNLISTVPDQGDDRAHMRSTLSQQSSATHID